MSFNLSLSPPQLEILTQPGKTIIQAYNVYNNDDQPITLKSSIESWLPQGNDGSVVYLPISTPSLVSFSLSNSEFQLDQPFTIAPKQKRQVILKIKTEPNTMGDSYHTLFLTQINTATSPNSSTASGKVGSHILISTSPNQTPPYQAKLIKITASPKLIDVFTSPIQISSEVENLGNFFFTAQGKITITKSGQTIKVMALDPTNVAAQSSRVLNCLENQQPVSCTLNPPLWPGIYTATISLDHPASTKALSTTFFVFPYWLALILLTFSLLTILILKKRASA